MNTFPSNQGHSQSVKIWHHMRDFTNILLTTKFYKLFQKENLSQTDKHVTSKREEADFVSAQFL